MDEAVVESWQLRITVCYEEKLTVPILVLPKGSTLVSVDKSGTRAWTITGRVVAL